MRKLFLLACAILPLCSTSYAGTILYTYTGTGTGDFAGTQFNATPFTFVVTGDTASRTGSGPSYSLVATNATIAVDGFSTADVSDTLTAYFSTFFALNSAQHGTIFLGGGPADLISPGGSYGFFLPLFTGPTELVATNGGLLTLTAATGTMTVSLGAESVPEPSSFVVGSGALIGMILVAKGRQTRLVRKRA
jgi:hypothetical protein